MPPSPCTAWAATAKHARAGGARPDYLLFVDADLRLQPQDAARLMAPRLSLATRLPM